MKVSKTVYPTNSLPLPLWYNYLSLEVNKNKGVTKQVKRIKASHTKNQLK
jgi:hypothetical protein